MSALRGGDGTTAMMPDVADKGGNRSREDCLLPRGEKTRDKAACARQPTYLHHEDPASAGIFY